MEVDRYKVDYKSSLDREHLKRMNEVEKFLKREKEVLYEEIKSKNQIEERKINDKLSKLKKEREELDIIISQKSINFPWLSIAISDYLQLQDGKIIDFLIAKKYPAYSSAEQVRAISKQKHQLTVQLLEARYRVKYYESLFPFLEEFVDEDIDELLIQIADGDLMDSADDDPVRSYLSSGEYESLSSAERNQRALDRYLKSRRPYQIGRDYERYVGYLYERNGYKVTYFGITEGLEDLGRDLICERGSETLIVQCKCWSKSKLIHEKHINQLFGTAIKYMIDQYKGQKYVMNPSSLMRALDETKVRPVLWTATALSDTAASFAKVLNVEVHQNHPMRPYPLIKCHINKKSGEKIYHLPFDQMYDKAILEKEYGEFYAETVVEAEEKGFRRAWRWRGGTDGPDL